MCHCRGLLLLFSSFTSAWRYHDSVNYFKIAILVFPKFQAGIAYKAFFLKHHLLFHLFVSSFQYLVMHFLLISLTDISRIPMYSVYWLSQPRDTRRTLNVHKTFRRHPGDLRNNLSIFNLRHVSMSKVNLLNSNDNLSQREPYPILIL